MTSHYRRTKNTWNPPKSNVMRPSSK